LFDRIRAQYDADVTIRDIAQELGPGLRRVQRWVRLIELPARNVMAPKPSTPAYYGAYLVRRWAEGFTAVKGLLLENQPARLHRIPQPSGALPCAVAKGDPRGHYDACQLFFSA
jgi:hypothetical protein